MKQRIKWMCVDENTDKTAICMQCYIYTWTHIHMKTYKHQHVYTWTRIHMNTHTHEHVYTWTHIHMNMYTYEHIYTWTHHFPYQGSTTRVSLKYQLLDLIAFIFTSTSKTLLHNHNTSDIHGNTINKLPQHYSSVFTNFTTHFTKLRMCDHSWNWPQNTLITHHRNIMVALWPDNTPLNK